MAHLSFHRSNKTAHPPRTPVSTRCWGHSPSSITAALGRCSDKSQVNKSHVEHQERLIPSGVTHTEKDDVDSRKKPEKPAKTVKSPCSELRAEEHYTSIPQSAASPGLQQFVSNILNSVRREALCEGTIYVICFRGYLFHLAKQGKPPTAEVCTTLTTIQNNKF